MDSNRLPRASRLRRRQLIRPLFDRGREDVASTAHGCIRLVYRVVPRTEQGIEAPVQVGFSPGRGHKRAVDRNRIKRRMREVYRVNQSVLAEHFRESDRALTLMVLFRGSLEQAASCIARDLPIALEKASRQLRQLSTDRQIHTQSTG
ncbi:MAG TPA: ribonuclease P protein component [Rhodothermales bacterium]